MSNEKLFAKMARVMGRLARLPKSGHNPHFNYDFVTDADVSDAVRQALAAENVAFLASMDSIVQVDKKTVATFTFTFGDGDTGETWSCQWQGEAFDAQDKGIAKAATSAVKYFLLKTLVLSAGDEVDTDAVESAPEKKKSPKSAAEQAKSQIVKRQWPSQTIQAIVDAKLHTNPHAITGALNHSNLTPVDAPDVCVEWTKQYRASRETGLGVEPSAAAANAWLAAQLESATPAPAMMPEQAPPVLDDVPRWAREIDL